MASRSLMFGGLAVAALAVLGVEALRQDNAAVAATPVTPVPATRVLVAVRALPVGHVTAPADFAWRDWPNAGLDPAYVIDGTRRDLSGQVVRTAFLPGEPVTPARLVAPGTRGILAAVTAPGMRAASLALSPAAGVSGLIEPGDRVDVILTQTMGERHGATTVLSDVRVVAVDAALAGKGRDAGAGGTASLEVSPRQSEILALAGEMGKVSLSLRALAGGAGRALGEMTFDTEISRLRGAHAAAMASAGAVFTAPAAVTAPSDVRRGPTISLFHGSTAEIKGVAR